jgi:simple sugar transport system permease protein
VHVPNASAGIFQALMLFFILASDILVRYRIRIVPSAKPVSTLAAGEAK